MQQFNIDVLVTFIATLQHFQTTTDKIGQDQTVVFSDPASWPDLIKQCDTASEFFWLPATKARVERLKHADLATMTVGQFRTAVTTLSETLIDELKSRVFVYLPPARAAHFLSGPTLLGKSVANGFPALVGDVDEAGKCLGCGRYTAAVFHLMRVMEGAVQRLGGSLGIPQVELQNWQVLLDQIDAALKRLPKGDPRRVEAATLTSLLHAVKLAWRNEVMHPKATYTEDEALDILNCVKAFVGKVASVSSTSP